MMRLSASDPMILACSLAPAQGLFAQSFAQGAAIGAKLRDNVHGYYPIVVKLQLAGKPEETVQNMGSGPCRSP